jgi:hypothetical protein
MSCTHSRRHHGCVRERDTNPVSKPSLIVSKKIIRTAHRFKERACVALIFNLATIRRANEIFRARVTGIFDADAPHICAEVLLLFQNATNKRGACLVVWPSLWPLSVFRVSVVRHHIAGELVGNFGTRKRTMRDPSRRPDTGILATRTRYGARYEKQWRRSLGSASWTRPASTPAFVGQAMVSFDFRLVALRRHRMTVPGNDVERDGEVRLRVHTQLLVVSTRCEPGMRSRLFVARKAARMRAWATAQRNENEAVAAYPATAPRRHTVPPRGDFLTPLLGSRSQTIIGPTRQARGRTLKLQSKSKF